jgi:hypothetical protein
VGLVDGQAEFSKGFEALEPSKALQPPECLRRDMEKYVTISYMDVWSMTQGGSGP